jgi:GTP pyrophosphokinase
MVKAANPIPRLPDGVVDVEAWCTGIADDLRGDIADVRQAIALVQRLPERSEEFLNRGLELADLLLSLNMDAASVAAGLLYLPVRTRLLSLLAVEKAVGKEVAGLTGAVVRMADTSLLEMSNSKIQSSESRDQVENIRRMLVSMIDDARVAVLKLAERVIALRAAKSADTARQMRIAEEAHRVFAPLANRLGVWQLKWELEDLALRYLAPEAYKAIARQLKGRRAEREAEIRAIVREVRAKLAERGIEASVTGRAKHIYSIWRKMRAKRVGLDEVYDVRAIRVLVDDIAQCYATLGVIHTQWQHVPSEFDDYVALPKENGYRSIHTAVSWNDGKTLEVQIRTRQMHEEAELGVCAHWAYKHQLSEDESFARKMDWMRQVVEWQEDAQAHIREDQIGVELSQRMREERIFVYTPKGHVLDLTTGATALDFAYRVHTEVGHRCRGARVDGFPVALNAPLMSGQRVEIVTGEAEAPLRSWLHEHLGCAHSGRAREKIADWFRGRPRQENVEEGRRLLDSTLARLALTLPRQRLARVASGLGCADVPECLASLGCGELQILDVLDELLVDTASGDGAPSQMSLLGDAGSDAGAVPARAGQAGEHNYSIEILAEDRPGLLMDVTIFLGRQGVTLVSNTGRVLPESNRAAIVIEVPLLGLRELLMLMDGLEQIPGVIRASRIDPAAESPSNERAEGGFSG